MSTLRRFEIRPVRPADAAAMARFVDGLGAPARRFRFHGSVNGCSERLAALLTGADGVRHAAWVACTRTDDGGEVIVGEVRYAIRADAPRAAELAISIADGWCGRGIADRLMQEAVRAARAAGIRLLCADVMEDNLRMVAFMRRHGFEVGIDLDGCHDRGALFERTLPPARRAMPASNTVEALGTLLRRLTAGVHMPRALKRAPAR